MVIKKSSQSEGVVSPESKFADKKTVIKKSVVSKPSSETEAGPQKINVTEQDASRMEEMLFGSAGKSEALPVKKGIIRKKAEPLESVISKPSEADLEGKRKSKLIGVSKTKIIRKGAAADAEAEKEEHARLEIKAQAEAEAAAVVAASKVRKSDTGKAVPEKDSEKELRKKKEREKEKEREKKKEKEEQSRLDPKALTPLAQAITVIKEETGEKAAISYKDFKPVEEEQYEEFEEVVEEVIEEVEYEEAFPEAAATTAKMKPDEPQAPFGARPFQRRRRKRKRKTPEDALAAKDAVKRTMAAIHAEDTASKKRYKKTETGEVIEVESNVLKVSDFMSIAELANLMNVKPVEVITACMKLGIMATINQRLDFDTITAVVDEFGFAAELMEEYAQETLVKELPEDKENLVTRATIVTVMGHVDHGKTSLLDYIRKTDVVAGESGGITQHIGAYRVNTKHGPVTFLDTPGHEAFATMRARGASITDLIILVVAADSHVMPQTIESIDHAKAAGVKLVVAINKVDLPTANTALIRNELAQHGVIVEDFGGNVVAVEISCKTGQNIPKLLEMVAAEAELLELKANPNRPAIGTIIESKMDSRLGSVATVLVQNGTLRVGDNFVTGSHSGRVKLMTDQLGNKIEEAGPTVPVQVLGMSGTPRAGDTFTVVENEKIAREISLKRSQAEKEKEQRQIKHMSLDDLYQEIKVGGFKDLNTIIKGDVDGSVEALSDALQKLSTDKLKVNIVHKSVGAIRESDVLLAATTNAIIIGFHVHPNSKVRELADKEGVEIRLYKIIYEAIEDIQKAAEGLLEPLEKEVILGQAEVRDLFKISKIGVIAGCSVIKGTIKRTGKVRLLRDSVEVVETKISSLKRLKDDVSQVEEGYECGIGLENFDDIKQGDIIEVFEIQKIKKSS